MTDREKQIQGYNTLLRDTYTHLNVLKEADLTAEQRVELIHELTDALSITTEGLLNTNPDKASELVSLGICTQEAVNKNVNNMLRD